MRKKFILLSLIVINTFALIGCGQSKTELKSEIKKEMKQEVIQKQESKTSDVTNESLKIFEDLYNKYNTNMDKSGGFILTDDNPYKITLEQGKELRNQTKSIEDEMLSKCPKYLKSDLTEYVKLYNEFLDKLEISMKNTNETISIGNDKSQYQLSIQNKIKELETELLNQSTK